MTLEKFTKIVSILKIQTETIHQLYKLKVDLIEYVDAYESVIALLIKEVYNDEGYDWFSWFCYELEFGDKVSKDNPRAWDKYNNPICYDVESLWSYLEAECKAVKIVLQENN